MSDQIVEEVTEGSDVLALHRRGEHYEVLRNGARFCATDQKRAEDGLAELALAPCEGRDDITVLVSGLGAGHTVRAVLRAPGVVRVDVVEISPAIVDWGTRFFGLTDPRVTLHASELREFLRQPRREGMPPAGWHALIVDIDEWPVTLARPENVEHYHPAGLAAFEEALQPGGVFTVWSANRDNDLEKRITARFQNVARVAVPREPDGIDYVYRGRRVAIQR